jgi:hypothetical protein
MVLASVSPYVDQQRWPIFALQIARVFDSTSTALMVQENDRPKILTMTENVIAGLGAYQAHYWKRDVWVQRGKMVPMPVGGS